MIAVFLCIDLLQISNRYRDTDLFVSPSRVKRAFTASAQDNAILQDSSHFRVYEPSLGLQGARTSYFHNAIGGYHGAKPRRFEELIELFQMKKHEPILNILNVKYILYEDKDGQPQVLQNPENLGAAWFVNKLASKTSADEVYQAMTETDFTTTALIEGEIGALPLTFEQDSLAQIQLTNNSPQEKIYAVKTSQPAFAVFSEMYYANGWQATIDGKVQPIHKVNYVLRGLEIPAGEHEIRFYFSPQIISTGSGIQLGAMLFLALLIAACLWKESIFQKT